MSEHTPGPWRIEQPPNASWTDIIGANDWCVCEYVENGPDRHLIAAAPDMLRALKAMAQHHMASPHIGLARAAIAKAEGDADALKTA